MFEKHFLVEIVYNEKHFGIIKGGNFAFYLPTSYLLTYIHTYLLTYLLTYLFTYFLLAYILSYLVTYLFTYFLLTSLITYIHTYLLTYSLVLRLSESFGLLHNRRPFFPVDCFSRHLPTFISLRSFFTSSNHRNLSSPSTSLLFTLKYFPNCPSLIYRVSVEKPLGKRLLGRSRLRWEDNIKMDF